jgi:hypothetical protein
MIAVTGLLATGTAAEAFFLKTRQWSEVVRYSVLLAGCSLVTVLNPYGIGLHKHAIEYLRSNWIKEMVEEFHSPNFHSESMLYFEILLFLGFAVAYTLLRRRRIVEALWIGYFAHTALTSARHVTIFVLIAGPLVAIEATRWWMERCRDQPLKSLGGILNQLAEEMAVGFRWASVWPGFLALGLVLIGYPVKWPTDFSDERFPTKILSANHDLIAGSRILTTDQWGDYLIIKFYPHYRVFIDGRSDFYGEDLGKEYLAVLQGQYNWQSVLDKYSFGLVLAPISWPLCSLLKQTSDWQVLADDGKAILFKRKTMPK